VLALLDVMDTVAELHPGFAARESAYASLPAAEREAAYHAARVRNDSSPALTQALDAMLQTETYQIYFRRFPNVTPEMLREIVLDLPYRRRPAPGGIGGLYYELVRDRDAVRSALERLIVGIDMGAVYATAEWWAPPVVDERPTMYLIYDSNAGSFSAEGKPFFNVHTSIDLAALDGADAARAITEAQGVMAHELQHVLADPVLYPEVDPNRSWQTEWVDRLTRGLVGEGLANHCNPPTGVKQAVYEDTMVVAALVKRLNALLLAMRDEQVTEDDVRAWYRANYSGDAEALLRAHLATRLAGDDLDNAMRRYASVRPDVEHALGWWMVSRISDGGARREAALELLTHPYLVYERYNAAVPDEYADVRLAQEAVAYVRSLHESTSSPG
jgi:hypothetical protein